MQSVFCFRRHVSRHIFSTLRPVAVTFQAVVFICVSPVVSGWAVALHLDKVIQERSYLTSPIRLQCMGARPQSRGSDPLHIEPIERYRRYWRCDKSEPISGLIERQI
jgi:hypothetical protein